MTNEKLLPKFVCPRISHYAFITIMPANQLRFMANNNAELAVGSQ